MNLATDSHPSLPAVPFSSQVVVVVALGTMRTTCCSIAVDSVVRGWMETYVFVTSHVVDRGCVVGDLFITPADVISFISSADPVFFVEAETTDAC